MGRISHNNLPLDSRWRSIGEPRRLSGITADSPKIASWKWRIPELSPGNRGHYCIVAFIQSSSDPIRETDADVGLIVGRNRQIAQKNLHIISVRDDHICVHEYIEFHNAYGEGKATFVIDLKNLPPEILVSFRLSRLNLSQPIGDAITGIQNAHEADPDREPVPEVAGITFENKVYECIPSHLVKIEYVYIDPNEFCAAVLYINIKKPLKPESEFYFEVQQIINDNIIVGGSTYVIRSVDEMPMMYRDEFEVKEEEISNHTYINPWLNPPPQFKKKRYHHGHQKRTSLHHGDLKLIKIIRL